MEDAEWMKGEILGRGRDIGFSGKMQTVVKHAISILGSHVVSMQIRNSAPDLVIEAKINKDKKKDTKKEIKDEPIEEMVLPNLSLPNVFELSYYSNSVISVFLLESVLGESQLLLIPHLYK